MLQKVLARLDQFILQYMDSANVPGLAIAITDREQLLHVATYGYADLAARVPIKPDTLFKIASIGKSFTSIALLQQHEAGRLDLHTPGEHYLPWFQVQSRYKLITVHNLMSHTAGIITGSDLAPNSRYEPVALHETETAFPPGKHFHYSNVGYKTLGFLLEDLLGQPYSNIIKSQIFEPLGMSATAPVITHETRKQIAVGYQRLYDDRPTHVSHPLVPATWVEYGMGDGSIASTPTAMAIYLRMLLNYGQGSQERILSKESFNLMTQRIIGNAPSEDIFYGYGLHISEIDGFTHIGHGGGFIGFNSIMLGDLDNGLGVFASVNASSGVPYDLAVFTLKLLRAALHKQEIPPLPIIPNLTKVENAADYAGTYKAGEQEMKLVDAGEQLILHYESDRIILERREPDSFYVNHPDALFLLSFRRQENQVVEAFYGSDWYVNEHYTGPTTFDYPQEWEAYCGHYRSHNPWFTNFRIILRKGVLVLLYPSGGGQRLIPLSNSIFQVSDHSPERICFDTIIDGQALCVSLSGCNYYRASTL